MKFEQVSRVLKQNLVTVPIEIRNKFDISEGCYIKWTLEDDNTITVKSLKFAE